MTGQDFDRRNGLLDCRLRRVFGIDDHDDLAHVGGQYAASVVSRERLAESKMMMRSL